MKKFLRATRITKLFGNFLKKVLTCLLENDILQSVRRKGVIKIKTLTLRLDDDFHKALKIKCIEENTDMSNYIIKLIKKDMKYPLSKDVELKK